ncbi:MAG: T9SS type A sorting domain-containing protein, partial [Bacteroidales bacterium]|nr:T9SS type A sorting domain-containing protein [Bacteroidales bacterium]
SWITSTTTPLNVTQGYAAWASSGLTGNATVEFKGTLNTGNQTASISYNNGANKGDGWNLVGNPFPSAIEWNSSWTKTNVDATIYVYDGTQYLTWNYNLGGFGTKTDGSIPSTQGFWVKANASSPALTIPNSERLHSSQSFYKDSEINNLITMQVNGNGYSDVTLIGFNQLATDNFDSDFDAYKIMGVYEAPQLYSIIPDHDLAVNFMADFGSDNEYKTVQLGFEVGQANTYTFNFSGLSEFYPEMSVYLEDRSASSFSAQGEKLIDIRNTQQYSFTAGPQDDPERFVLHFNLKEKIFFEDKNLDLLSGTQIYSYEKTVYIYAPEVESAEVFIYDLLGQLAYSGKIEGNTLNTFDLSSASGYYVVNVVCEKGNKKQKVYIR